MYTTITNHIELDREQRSVRKDGQTVHLTGLEYGLLAFLSAHPNRICSRQELLDHIWGDRFQYDTGTIDVHLNALRRKLGWTKKEPIETIRGIGFIFGIISMIIFIMIYGYSLDIKRNTIHGINELPKLNFTKNLVDGVKTIFVTIVYTIIPLIITLIIASPI